MVFVPKSVLLVVEVATPIGTLFPFPLILNETFGAEVVVNPLATPPGLTQLDTLPVMAKLVSVPVLAPAASIKSV